MNAARREQFADWLIYAMGGGLGHFSRSLALARAAAKRGRQVELLYNSPLVGGLPVGDSALLGESIHLERLPPEATPTEVVKRLQRRWERPPRAFIVDCFPRGLGGELADFRATPGVLTVLTQRRLNPAYAAHPGVSEAASRYDLVIHAGEKGPFTSTSNGFHTPPWLLLDSNELTPRKQARDELGAPPDLPLVLIVGAGRREEIISMRRLAKRANTELGESAAVRFVSPSGAESLCCWPLLRWLRGVDLLVGAGGYNTVHEARAANTPLIAFARRRMYDRQAERLRSQELVRSAPEAIRRIGDFVAAWKPAECARVAYVNGAHEAARIIDEAIR